MKPFVYFNYAGVAPISYQLVLQLIRFLAHFYFLGPRSALLKYEKYIPLLAQEISTLMRCDPSEISYIKNTTEGIIIAAESLPLREGDEVLVMGCEYPANLIPWLKKRDEGILVNVIEGGDSATSFEKLIQSISERTRAISLSWVQFQDGYMSDIARLSEVCKAREIFLVVDAVQIVGTREVDLSQVKIDILVCGGHKHLMSIMGCGFIYINQQTLLLLSPYKVGIRSVESFSKDGFHLKKTTGRFEDGTANLLGIISLYHQIQLMNRVKVSVIEEKTKGLLNYYKQVLTENQIPFVCYPEQGNMISIISKNPSLMMEKLEKHGFYVRVINNKFIRVAFSFKNSKRDIQRFVPIFKRYQHLL
jgi:selenocysteine lyase/cysteine desulfurase